MHLVTMESLAAMAANYPDLGSNLFGFKSSYTSSLLIGYLVCIEQILYKKNFFFVVDIIRVFTL